MRAQDIISKASELRLLSVSLNTYTSSHSPVITVWSKGHMVNDVGIIF